MAETKSNPPAPEETNYNHPAAPGQRKSVPGEGVIHRGGTAEAGAKIHPDQADECMPGVAPGAQRAGTALNPPADIEPRDSAGPAATETADPNYTAASPKRRDERQPSEQERVALDRGERPPGE